MIINCLAEELIHPEQKRRTLAIEIIKIHVKDELSVLFRNCLINIVAESEAFTGCLITIKKLLSLSSFLAETELFFEMLSTKLTSIQTGAEYKM
jgi:hypothetical protein